MKRSYRRILFYILITALFFLSGCGKEAELTVTEQSLSFTVRQTALNLPENEVAYAALLEDGILIQQKDAAGTVFCLTDGYETVRQLQTASEAFLSAVTVAEDSTIWMAEQSDAAVTVTQMTQAGEGLTALRISWASELDVCGLCVDITGTIYLLGSGSTGAVLYICSGSGELLGQWTGDTAAVALTALQEDKVAILLVDGTLTVVDTQGEETARYDLPVDARGLCGGADGTVYILTPYTLYCFDEPARQLQSVAEWTQWDLSAAPDYVLAVSPAEFLAFSAGSLFEIEITETDGEAAEKQTLTLAVLGSFSPTQAVREFNALSDACEIKIVDYTGMDETRFKTELAAGIVPDLFAFGSDRFGAGVSAERLGAAGYLLDLYALFEENGVAQESFLTNILDAAAQDGPLYALPLSFYIDVVAGKSELVGDEMGWTFSDLQNTLAAHPEVEFVFGSANTRQWMLGELLAFNMGLLVDWDSGVCQFDTDEFRGMLELVKDFPAEAGTTTMSQELQRAAEGSLLLVQETLSTINSVQTFPQIFGDAYTMIGFPTDSGVGNAAHVQASLAISASCDAPEAAWEFFSLFLTEDNTQLEAYGAGGFPVYRPALETKLENAGNEEAWSAGYGSREDGTWVELVYTAPTEEDVALIRALIDSLDRVRSYDATVLEIVLEEAEAYFSGDKDLNTTVSIITSRVQVYVDENT